MRVNAKLEDKQLPEWIDWLMADNFFKKKSLLLGYFKKKIFSRNNLGLVLTGKRDSILSVACSVVPETNSLTEPPGEDSESCIRVTIRNPQGLWRRALECLFF